MEIIQSFWEQHVHSFKISHGTTSLYHSHFKTYGISSTYPQALENTIAKIRRVWANHEHDIAQKTGYFINFEQRYDLARSQQQVALSFSAQGDITQEYTTGARHGGEWIRELRHFLREASRNKHALSPDEQQTLLEVESLIDVMSSVPSMIVKIPAGCPDLNHVFGPKSLLRPLNEFAKYIKLQCKEWDHPNALSSYMYDILLPQLEAEKTLLASQYEISLHSTIAAEHLEFEFIDQSAPTRSSSSTYPKLEFNQPQEMSNDDVCRLWIEHSGFSDIEEYQDSRFECQYSIEGKWTVTRKPLTEKDQKALALTKEKKALRQQWMRTFCCEK